MAITSRTIERHVDRVRRPARRLVLVLFAAFVVVAAACGGGDDAATGLPAGPGADVGSVDDGSVDDGSVDDGSAAGGEEALAEVIRIDASVDARLADASDYVLVNEPAPVAVGDDVRTDSTGFAEIAYFDGSVTRLDIDTEFTVVELVDSPGDSLIRTRMGVGRTWHRVQGLSGNDTYEVETSAATAVVRGTAFYIFCADVEICTFAVVEGTLEIVLPDGTVIDIEGPQLVIIENGKAGDPTPLGPETFDDEWLARNNDLDIAADNDDLIEMFPTPADYIGVWDVELDLVSWEPPDPLPSDWERLGIVADPPVTPKFVKWLLTECGPGGCDLVVALPDEGQDASGFFSPPCCDPAWDVIRLEPSAAGLIWEWEDTAFCDGKGTLLPTTWFRTIDVGPIDPSTGSFSGTLSTTYGDLNPGDHPICAHQNIVFEFVATPG